MPGTWEFDPGGPSEGPRLDRERIDAVVYRYAGGLLEPLPNVVCLSVSARIGPEPWGARFRYRFDQRFPAWPSAVEHVLPLAIRGDFAASPYVVQNEDRLVVRLPLPGDRWEVLFDGFAQLPQADLGGGEQVTFEAVGAPVRCWDYPIPGAVLRDADDPEKVEDSVVFTGLPARFNPDGRGNATKQGYDEEIVGETGRRGRCPVFMDEKLFREEEYLEDPADVDVRRWTLGMAARYLLVGGNVDELFVKNPDLVGLANLLLSIRPVGSFFINWAVTTTFELKLIIVPDTDVTGMAWPEALQELIEPHGFGMFFDLLTDEDGLPDWHVRVRRNDDNTFWKVLGMQARGAALDPALTAVAGAGIQRDGLLANEAVVDSEPERFEASFVLAPIGWEPDPADAGDGDRDKWVRGKPAFEREKYRLYGLDEAGEGHWAFRKPAGGGSFGAADDAPAWLAKVFHPETPEEARKYARRRRRPIRQLLTADAEGNPLPAELWFAVLDDYAADFDPGELAERQVPGVWEALDDLDWQQVTEGGWQLLPDRVGILVTAENARAWKVTGEGERPVEPSGVLDLVRGQADPQTTTPTIPRVVFRLTCVVESDRGVEAEARRRPPSPTVYTVRRRVDARDRFGKSTVSTHSHLLPAPGTLPKVVRDDADEARSYAEALRREREAVRFAGTLSIPRVTTGVRLGDKVIGIAGREISFGSYLEGMEEGPRYPMCVGIEWGLDGDQSTRLMLADRRAEVAR